MYASAFIKVAFFLWLFLVGSYPADFTHRVKPGETLDQIAKRYRVSIGALMAANALSNPNRIRSGARLVIPNRHFYFKAIGHIVANPNTGSPILRRKECLEGFIGSLERLASGKNVPARLLFLGDSHIKAGFFTQEVRRYGLRNLSDGGPGLLIPPPENEIVYTRGTVIRSSYGWQTVYPLASEKHRLYSITMCRHAGLRPGATVEVTFEKKSSLTEAEVWYVAHPKGERFTIEVNGMQTVEINTHSEKRTIERATALAETGMRNLRIISQQERVIQKERLYRVRPNDSLFKIARMFRVKVFLICKRNGLTLRSTIFPHQKLIIPPPPRAGADAFSNVNWENVPVQILCIVAEAARPGLVVDTAGMNGATVSRFVLADERGFTRQIAWRDYNLVVIAFGANEVFMNPFNEVLMAQNLRTLHNRITTTLPDAGILFMSPPDMTERRAGIGQYETVHRIVKETADSKNAAFWDQRDAMGGYSSHLSWRDARLMQEDLVHPTRMGYVVLARLFSRELFDDRDVPLIEK